MSKVVKKILFGAALLMGTGLAAIYVYSGTYGFNVIARRGISTWTEMAPDHPRLPVPIKLALVDEVPKAFAGSFDWVRMAPGFEVGEMPVLASGKAVDRILLARVDTEIFRIVVRNSPHGNKDPEDWLKKLKAVLIVNGGYFDRRRVPTTPVIMDGVQAGPVTYEAAHGAYVLKSGQAHIVDLQKVDWREAFDGANEALVSYPMLVREASPAGKPEDTRWLANRSFIGEDAQGRMIIGTTTEAFFSLARLSEFLTDSPLDLRKAINLDGGPVACQGIKIGRYERDFCGDWELTYSKGKVRLPGGLIGKRRWGLVNVLAVLPRGSNSAAELN